MLTNAISASLIFCMALVTSSLIPADAQSPVERLHKIVEDNTLDKEGNLPFHLKIAFQLYDLEGKPSETGFVEEWWISKEQHRINIDAPSLKTQPPTTGPAPESYFRERSLVYELLRAEVRPVPNYVNLERFIITDIKRTEDKLPLHCSVVMPKNPVGLSISDPNYCVDPGNDALRLRIDAYSNTVSRNSIGSFRDTNVALALQIAFRNRLAMTGHVVALNTFDPAKSNVKFDEVENLTITSEEYPDLIASGHRIVTVEPIYPTIEPFGHRGGLVALRVRIEKDGSVHLLSTISSTDSRFTAAAQNAVRHWKYAPFIWGHGAVEVDTTIYINFIAR